MRKINLLAAIAFLICIPCLVSANSLWLSGKDLYSSRGARVYQPGDIITVEIEEESEAKSQASTNTQKETKTEVTSSPKIPIFKGVVDKLIGSSESNNEFDGEGTTSRSGSLSGTVTATVLEVLANGNLLIEGSRSVVVNKETQLMRVRGVARPSDIDSDNVIKSSLLADAQIKYDGKGSVGKTQRRGIMTQVFDTIF